MDELSQTESTPCSGTDPEANTLIVNELLTFVSDKINTMPYDMLVKLLTDFYSDEDITTAKSILYDTAFCSRDTPRLIKRKGKDKNINNIQDIVNIFLEMPPSSLPSYVAKDLSHLPETTTTHNKLFRCRFSCQGYRIPKTTNLHPTTVVRDSDQSATTHMPRKQQKHPRRHNCRAGAACLS